MRFTIFLLVFFITSIAHAASPAQNWIGPYRPCRNHDDLLTHRHMDLGVRFSTTNIVLAQQFEKAMNFWSEILDMTWHEDDSENCSMQLVDGAPELFASGSGFECAAARAQLPDRLGFQGWIAFNPAISSTSEQMYRDAVHEIGHLLGLQHNPSSLSVMFFNDFGQESSLDDSDLRALAALHKLRPGVLDGTAHVTEIVSLQTE